MQTTAAAAPPAFSAAAGPEEALALFDRLPAVEPTEMLGRWLGGSFATGHPLDGVLETFHWYGKAFRGPDDVDPLLPDPRWLERWPWLGTPAVGSMFQRLALPLWITHHPQARLRVVEHRGVASAAMLYDHLPIVDVFRRLDAHTLLGVMDARGISQPFFFTLRREGGGSEDASLASSLQKI
jgi:hypothetical protein